MYLRLIPCIKADAQTAADIVFEEWWCVLGISTTVKSDRGTHFTAEVFKAMCLKAGVDHKFGAPDRHESQGQVERQNQLMTQVRCMCGDAQRVDEWPDAIIRMQLTHNACISATTGYAPLRVITGRRPRTVETLMDDEELVEEEWWDRFGDHMASREKIVETTCTRERSEAVRKKRNVKLVRRNQRYVVGDLVRLKRSIAARGLTGGKKLATINSELYRVAEVYADGWTYRLKPWRRKGREKIRHFDSLMRGYDRNPDLRAVDNVVDVEHQEGTSGEGRPVERMNSEEAVVEAGEPAEFETAGDEGSQDGDEPDESDSSWHNDEEAEEVLSTDESIPEAAALEPAVRTPRPTRRRLPV